MFRKLLIANRGEIACRIIRTARKMGIRTVAVYSAADAQSLHVQQADEAFYIGPSPAHESYLNIEAILQIAKQSGAEAIHPGYGFLSENQAFATACETQNIIFIGPSVEALKIMGSKLLAKQHLANSPVPLIPGYHGEDQSDQRLLQEAETMGFPVLIKAANGGGGKGMRTVTAADQFLEALASARRESLSSFADDTMILEKLIQNPRHIEIQIMADHFDHVVHLFERDCSIQRRHQKVLEEAPANHLPPTLRQKLADAAIAVAKAIGYRGAGTIECLVDDTEQFYFMEMNTRLQVEHPVTELITGLDLVEWQIKIAANHPLPCQQSDIHAHGHALECRLYAEDPTHNFMPSTGHIRFLREPKVEHLRIDTGITEDSSISMYYDPMIAKLITWGETRVEAIQRMCSALEQYHLSGIKTNRAFLLAILNHPLFLANTFTTDFLNQTTLQLSTTNVPQALFLAAAIDYAALTQQSDPLYQDTFGWQMHLNNQWISHYRCIDQSFTIQITPNTKTQVSMALLDTAEVSVLNIIDCTADSLRYDDGHTIQHVYYEREGPTLTIFTAQGPLEFQRLEHMHTIAQTAQSQLTAPMPGTVVAILKQPGDQVVSGDALLVLEAMKMEHTIRAPNAGTVQEIFYPVGAQVSEGATLAALEPLL
ncbi:MAG: 3-methylcrotonyl-CoA carboxylase [Legionella sp.]|nr:MAG: 3-methylcrotonyl-CoA carboxylase [Legionella sp.]